MIFEREIFEKQWFFNGFSMVFLSQIRHYDRKTFKKQWFLNEKLLNNHWFFIGFSNVYIQKTFETQCFRNIFRLIFWPIGKMKHINDLYSAPEKHFFENVEKAIAFQRFFKSVLEGFRISVPSSGTACNSRAPLGARTLWLYWRWWCGVDFRSIRRKAQFPGCFALGREGSTIVN